jgi:hypothetical protein
MSSFGAVWSNPKDYDSASFGSTDSCLHGGRESNVISDSLISWGNCQYRIIAFLECCKCGKGERWGRIASGWLKQCCTKVNADLVQLLQGQEAVRFVADDIGHRNLDFFVS